MKRIALLVMSVLIGTLVIGMPAEAQKKKKKGKKENSAKSSSKDKASSKDDEKEWKKRLKKLTANQYKAIMEEYYDLKNQVVSFEDEMAAYKAGLAEKDQTLKKYQAELSKLRKALALAKRARPAASGAGGGNPNAQYNKGIVFRVQIGAYERINLNQYAGQENFGVEQVGGMTKYMIGNFRNFREADVLKTYIQKMGLKDAFVVAYRDGTRVEVSSVRNAGAGQGR